MELTSPALAKATIGISLSEALVAMQTLMWY
jgi:hypothetical protein